MEAGTSRASPRRMKTPLPVAAEPEEERDPTPVPSAREPHAPQELSPFRRMRPMPDGGVRSILERLQLEDSSSRYLPGYEEMGRPQALPAPPPSNTPGARPSSPGRASRPGSPSQQRRALRSEAGPQEGRSAEGKRSWRHAPPPMLGQQAEAVPLTPRTARARQQRGGAPATPKLGREAGEAPPNSARQPSGRNGIPPALLAQLGATPHKVAQAPHSAQHCWTPRSAPTSPSAQAAPGWVGQPKCTTELGQEPCSDEPEYSL